MSILKVNPSDYQSITVATNPSRYYASSSNGVTGSVHVFARRSTMEKSIDVMNIPGTPFNEAGLYNTWIDLVNAAEKNQGGNEIDFKASVSKFLDEVNAWPVSEKKQKTLDIVRFNPSYFFSTGTIKKSIIRDNLSHYYRTAYPSAHWAYSNYHSLNFFSSSTVPTSSVLLYPNDNDGFAKSGYATGRYTMSGAFSFDFYINPRYNRIAANGHFAAGTIFHLSSSYALSLITGSQKDVNGLPTAFRLQLQLSHSADISPSKAIASGYPNNLIFLSDDNVLQHNNWHHVVVRWGTNLVNHGTGSFNIDGVDRGKFVLPSGTIAPLAYLDNSVNSANPDALCVGNYYEGNNVGDERLKKFFSADPSVREGLLRMDSSSGNNGPSGSVFRHPLQAEIHDLSIKKFYVADADIAASSSTGLSNTDNVSFYLPPFFVMSSSIRQKVSGQGGVLQTPAIEADGTTTTPFNTTMAFGVGGHYINTENFLKDFASSHFPRQLFLSASKVTSGFSNANDALYSQPAVRRRNLLILPCDDGNFYPNYDILANEYYASASYSDDLGNYSPGFISLLTNGLSETSLLENVSQVKIVNGQEINKTSEEIDAEENLKLSNLIGFTPSQPLASAKSSFDNYLKSLTNAINSSSPYENLIKAQRFAPLATIYKTKDSSSNQVVFFDISNLYYGLRILPGSFTISDSSLSGSGGAVSMTIKDDGNGTLYRADSLTPHCEWNSVGTIFYNEGIIAIKSPHLYFFGKDQYEISFKGEQNIHVLRIETTAPVNYLNSSSNPTYKVLPSTLRPNEPDSSFVYVTGINFHDDNLNVVMKTQLAQPIMKRNSQKLLFKVKYDF